MSLALTNLTYKDVKPLLKKLVDRLFERVPAGVGSQGFVKLDKEKFKRVVEGGAEWAVKNGYGNEDDLEKMEENGCIKEADSNKVSDKALTRGVEQIGTLGSGNHYLEIQRVLNENIIDKRTAKKWGLFEDQIVVMWHCLPGDAKVLTEYGVWVEIKELKNKSLKVKCFDRKTGNLVDTEIEEFFEVSKKERMFEIKTQSGFKICVTEDHPILTKKGYLTPTVLSENDFVTINPFTGVDYSKLDDSVLVEEETIRKIYDSDKLVTELKEKKLLPLRMNSPQLPILVKLLGYITGDGHVRKAGRGWRVYMGGDLVDLEKIRFDLKKIGFEINKIYTKKTNGTLISVKGEFINVYGKTNYFECSNSAIVLLLMALGVPYGRKTVSKFAMPKFLLSSPRWIKRLFLAGYFGAELTKPLLSKYGGDFDRLTLALYKVEGLRKDGFKFLKQISRLLEEFNVTSIITEEKNGGRITTVGKTVKLVLRISSRPDNLIKFFSQVGYEYCERKSILANHALYFLRLKDVKLNKLARMYGVSSRAIKYKPYQYNFTFARFFDFKKNLIPGTGVVFDKITSIMEIENEEDFVYDIMVKNNNHNFIANNFIVGNCGSRGFGHQLASDYMQKFLNVMESKYQIKVLDRELACAPFNSQEGQDYFSAMKCGINMSFANRQVILHRIREVFSELLNKPADELGIKKVYDVAHNTAKVEEYFVDGKKKKLLVHRKGATRALGPGNLLIPKFYREEGQPVIIGGSMESGSYLLAGTKGAEEETFGSTCHGSGRTMSRNEAKRTWRGDQLQKDMEKRGIYVKTTSFSGLAEEAGGAYKDVDEVIMAAEKAGISKRVCKLIPIGNVKG